MNGAELAARYAFPPNSLGYCGGRGFRDALLAGKASAIERGLKEFHVHYAYLRLIARENGMKPFDRKVVEAFWLGNRLLGSVSTAALQRFIPGIIRNPARAARLCDGLPEGILPHHSFNPLYINFAADSVPRSVENYDSCCVTWGRVLSVSGNAAAVRRHSIAQDAGGFRLEQKDGTVRLERRGVRLAGKLRSGDLVSIHWGMAVQKLRAEDCEALKRYTMINIRACNDAAKGD